LAIAVAGAVPENPWRVYGERKAKAKCGSQSGGGFGMRAERTGIGFDRGRTQ